MKALSLFSGMGIGEMYLKDIEINVVVANEGTKEKARVYKYFHPKTNMIYGDIREDITKYDIIKEAKDNNVEVLLIRFTNEVSDFEKANKANSSETRKELDDERKKKYIDSMIDIIDALELKYIFIECDRYDIESRKYHRRECINLLDIFKDEYHNSYNIDSELINYADLGVPQSRKKGVIRLWKEELTWNKIEKLEEHITVKEAIGYLPSIEFEKHSDIKNHYSRNIENDYSRNREKKQIEWMKYTPTGKSAIDNEKNYPCKEDGTKIKGYRYTYKRIDWDKVAPICRYSWMISGVNTVHPGRKKEDGTWSDARVLTDRELLILSSVDGDLEIPYNLIRVNEFRKYLETEIPPIGLKNILRGIEGTTDTPLIGINNIPKETESSTGKSAINAGEGSFFYEAREGSVVKVEIVSKYFSTWIKRMKNKVDKLTYIDLYSGQGIYDDGTESTPIKIIKHCLEDDLIANKIRMIFNDMDKDTSAKLTANINNLENIEKLKHNPLVFNQEINSASYNELKLDNIGNSFAFIDPFGYKGLSKNLIDKLTKTWQNECLFFFNYNEINRGIRNDKVEEVINDLFGDECANTIRNKIDELYFESGISKHDKTAERETIIIDEFCNQFSLEGKYVIPFRFESESRKCTSHYLIFVTKNYVSLKIMKDIMNEISTYNIDGVGTFSYIPNHNKRYKDGLTYKYAISNILELENMMYELEPRRKEIKVEDLCRKYVINSRFTEKNIKDILKSMECKGKIIVQSKYAHRRKGTMGDNNIIVFKDIQ